MGIPSCASSASSGIPSKKTPPRWRSIDCESNTSSALQPLSACARSVPVKSPVTVTWLPKKRFFTGSTTVSTPEKGACANRLRSQGAADSPVAMSTRREAAFRLRRRFASAKNSVEAAQKPYAVFQSCILRSRGSSLFGQAIQPLVRRKDKARAGACKHFFFATLPRWSNTRPASQLSYTAKAPPTPPGTLSTLRGQARRSAQQGRGRSKSVSVFSSASPSLIPGQRTIWQ